jgi:hypothetical protein
MEKFFEELKNPGSLYRGAPFWAWNGKLETEELRRQIRIMKEMGLGGYFMHSRVGLDTPYLSEEWFECINACADEGEKNKMLAFLYDEDRWPSGAAGGLVTKNKKYRMKHLVMKITNDPKKIKYANNLLGVFIVEFEGNIMKNYRKVKKGEKIGKLSQNEKILIFTREFSGESDWYNGYTYLDTMDPEAVKQFIKITHENYKKYCGKYFGSVIPGIFTDEPNYGSVYFHYEWPPSEEGNIAIPWTDRLPEKFKNRYGYNILDYLPEIYYDIEGQKISKIRHDYFDCITYLFVDSFAKQIGNWCEKNKLLFTGHILAEDSLTSQTKVVGNCLRFYEYMQAPGMDLLTEHWRIFNTAKQVSSVARQFGRKFRLTETYGCTGWDFPFVGHKALGDWQVALGINLRCQHLSWYTMLGEAKRDYPASIFYQSPWWNTYKYVEDYFARIHLVMTQGEEIRDLLVIHPVESMWSVFKMPSWKDEEKKWEYSEEVKKLDEIFVKLCDILLSNHIDFDYGDEEILTRWAKIQKKGKDAILKVNIAEYKAVLVPPLYTIRSSTLKLLKKFREEGGMVIFVENIPSFVDCQFSDEVKKFAENCIVVQSIEESLKHLERIRKISIKDENGEEIKEILYLLREDRNYFYLFLCNTSMEWDKNISKYYPVIERKREFKDVIIKAIPEWKYRPVEINPQTGEIYYPETIKDENGYKIKTDFPPIASHLYIIPKKKEIDLKIEEMKKYKTVRSLKIEKEKWNYFLTEKNVLVLDMPYFKIKDGEWQEKKEILKVDREVRKYLGLSQRGGAMIQPWARKISKNPKSVKVSLKYEFYVEELPEKEISIAIEKPELYSIYINNFKLSTDMKNGWWVDKSLETISFEPTILRKGENEILLETYYNENHPGFEIIYLLGDFGVKLENKKPVIISLPENLKTGDWTGQGLPFYSGNLGYLLQIEKIDFNEKEKVFLRIPEFRGAGVRIFIDGKEVGILAWEPYEIDITDFIKGKEKSNLIIEILGHRRNSHGPLHYFEKWPVWTGPGQFVSEGEQWTDEYQIVPCGLMKNPEILIKKENV